MSSSGCDSSSSKSASGRTRQPQTAALEQLGHLPEADGGEPQPFACSVDLSTASRWTWVSRRSVGEPPEQDVRVEQDAHQLLGGFPVVAEIDLDDVIRDLQLARQHSAQGLTVPHRDHARNRLAVLGHDQISALAPQSFEDLRDSGP